MASSEAVVGFGVVSATSFFQKRSTGGWNFFRRIFELSFKPI
jgi:hypothetical protein